MASLARHGDSSQPLPSRAASLRKSSQEVTKGELLLLSSDGDYQ